MLIGNQDDETPRRVLVLGAGGKVATMVRAAWTATPPASLALTWQSRGGRAPGSISWRPGAPASDLPRVDAILALWGVTGGDEDSLSLNTALALHAQRLGALLGADRVLHCSSAAVYAPGPEPRDEAAPTRPASAYGRAKLAMERALTEAAAGPRACLMRIGNVAGADSLFASLEGDAPLVLDDFGGGRGPLRSYIGPETLAAVLHRLLICPDETLPECLNLAADPPARMDAVARAAGVAPGWRRATAAAVERLTLATPRLDALGPVHHGRGAPETLVAEWRRCSGRAK